VFVRRTSNASRRSLSASGKETTDQTVDWSRGHRLNADYPMNSERGVTEMKMKARTGKISRFRSPDEFLGNHRTRYRRILNDGDLSSSESAVGAGDVSARTRRTLDLKLDSNCLVPRKVIHQCTDELPSSVCCIEATDSTRQ